MKKILLLILLFAFCWNIKAQDSVKTRNCDSIITYISKRHRATVYLMAGDKISHRMAFERLKMFRSSSEELKKVENIGRYARPISYVSFGLLIGGWISGSADTDHQAGFIPAYAVLIGLSGSIASMILGVNASNHVKKAFELYNWEICHRKP